MGKLNLNQQRLAQLKSFAQRGQIEEAVINAIINKVRCADLSAAAEAGEAIVVTGTVYELDGTPVVNAPVHVRSIPETGGKGLTTVVGDAGVLTSGTHTFGFTDTAGETLIIEGSNDGGVTWDYFTRTYTMPVATSPADIAALLAKLQVAGDWDGAALPTEFAITNAADTLVVTMTDSGDQYAIRIGAASTAIGTTSDEDLMFTAGDQDIGVGAHVVMGDGEVDVVLETGAGGVFAVSVANDQAEGNMVEVMIDDGLVELLQLTFA